MILNKNTVASFKPRCRRRDSLFLLLDCFELGQSAGNHLQLQSTPVGFPNRADLLWSFQSFWSRALTWSFSHRLRISSALLRVMKRPMDRKIQKQFEFNFLAHPRYRFLYCIIWFLWSSLHHRGHTEEEHGRGKGGLTRRNFYTTALRSRWISTCFKLLKGSSKTWEKSTSTALKLAGQTHTLALHRPHRLPESNNKGFWRCRRSSLVLKPKMAFFL